MPPTVRLLVNKGLKSSTGKWLVLSSLVGIGCGIIGLLFYWATQAGFSLLMRDLVGYDFAAPAGELPLSAAVGDEAAEAVVDEQPHGMRWWLLLLLLTGGGLGSGLIIHFVSRTAAGAGAGAALDAFHHDHGRIRLRTVFAKFAATTVTFATGGSAGREGPIALIGAGLGSVFGGFLRLSSRDRRILLLCGVAGGVAALFRAPLAGAFFAAEVLYRDTDVESESLMPCFISAILAYVTFGVMFLIVFPDVATDQGFLAPLFATPAMQFRIGAVGHLVGYTLIGLAVALCCRWNVRLLTLVEASFGRLPGPWFLRPAIGALLTGVVAVSLYALVASWQVMPPGDDSVLAVLGSGYGILQQGLSASFGAGVVGWQLALVLAVIALGKMVTTGFTVVSGGSGGLFGPSLVIGGCIGAAIGYGIQGVGGIAPPVGACLIMGMVGYLAAGYKTPVAALLMISEMTGSYSLLLPGMWVCALAYLSSGTPSLIRGQVRSPLDSPAHRGHFFNDILAGIKVERVFDAARVVRSLQPSSSIDECKRLVTETHQSVYPLVAEDGRLCGIFSLNDLRSFLYDESLGLVAVAEDVATSEVTTVRPADSLATALRCFTDRNLEELPVVDDERRFLGLLTRRQVIAYYNEVLDEIRAQRREEGYDDDASGNDRPSVATR